MGRKLAINPVIVTDNGDKRTKVTIRDGGPGGLAIAEIYYQAGADGIPKYNAAFIALLLVEAIEKNPLVKNHKGSA